jgi:D-alanine-D-alanine ligase
VVPRRLCESGAVTRAAAAQPLRILLLTDQGLVPDRPRSKLKGRERELKKTEYDVLAALKRLKHDVTCVGLGDDLSTLARALRRAKPHVTFTLVEELKGLPYFDQHVVSYLQLRKQKYTGCNPRGLMIARDKALTKQVLTYHRIPVPRFAVIPQRKKMVIPKRLRFPLFVKPLTVEGSEGISNASLVRDADKLRERVAFIHEKVQSSALVEEFIEGRELYVGVFGNELLTALPPWELTMRKIPDGSPLIATDKAKWDPKHQKKVGLVTGPAQLKRELAGNLERLSKRIYRLLGLNGYARLDYRMTKAGVFHLLEANPNPQIARDEDFARSAKHANIDYEDLLQKLVTLAQSYTPRS